MTILRPQRTPPRGPLTSNKSPRQAGELPAAAQPQRHEAGAAAHAKLAVNCDHVLVRGVEAEVECLRDFFFRLLGQQQPHHAALRRSERTLRGDEPVAEQQLPVKPLDAAQGGGRECGVAGGKPRARGSPVEDKIRFHIGGDWKDHPQPVRHCFRVALGARRLGARVRAAIELMHAEPAGAARDRRRDETGGDPARAGRTRRGHAPGRFGRQRRTPRLDRLDAPAELVIKRGARPVDDTHDDGPKNIVGLHERPEGIKHARECAIDLTRSKISQLVPKVVNHRVRAECEGCLAHRTHAAIRTDN